MKKLFLKTVVMLIGSVSFYANAQSTWTNNGTHIYNPNAGNVGIGVTSPTQKLEIGGNLRFLGTANRLLDVGDGYSADGEVIKGYSLKIKAGTTTHLDGEYENAIGGDLILEAGNGSGGDSWSDGGAVYISGGSVGIDPASLPCCFNNNVYLTKPVSQGGSVGIGTYTIPSMSGGCKMAVSGNSHFNGNIETTGNVMVTGNIGLGTTCIPSGYKLAIDGKLICEEVKVKLANGSGCWPDYVFGKEYKLMSLSELNSYIQKNKHLPEVPTSEEVEQNGINTAEMLKIQMQKIEELTLYMIELKKENELMKQEMSSIKNSQK